MKILTNAFCFMLILFMSSAISGVPTNYQSNEKKKEKDILAKINALPEVKLFMQTAKASKPMTMIAREPEIGFKYYWIKVGIGNLDIFRTNFDFYVDPKSSEIYYLDHMVDDDQHNDIITLSQWRHWRNHPNFKVPHYYKGNKIMASKK